MSRSYAPGIRPASTSSGFLAPSPRSSVVPAPVLRATPREVTERLGHSFGRVAVLRPGETAVRDPASVIQRKLFVDTSDGAYLSQVRAHLQELGGERTTVSVDSETGEVGIKANEEERHKNEADTRDPGHRLLHSLVSHERTTTIRSAKGADSNSSQPILPPNSGAGKVLDWFKDFQFMKKKGFLTHRARAFVHGADPSKGVDTIVHYDANMSDEERKQLVRDRETKKATRKVAPQSVTLGHELIHSDHFHRGVAAYDRFGTPVVASREHTHDTERGEQTNLEEINTVGLDFLPSEHRFHEESRSLFQNSLRTYQSEPTKRDRDARTVTEQDLRKQLGLDPRAGYER